MTRKTAAIVWPFVALALAAVIGALAVMAVQNKPPEPAPVIVEVVKPGPTAAQSVTRFLGGLILVAIVGAIAAVGVSGWAARERARGKLERAAMEAQIRGALEGGRAPSRPAQPARPALPPGGTYIVLPGGQYPQYPPVVRDPGGWEVEQ